MNRRFFLGQAGRAVVASVASASALAAPHALAALPPAAGIPEVDLLREIWDELPDLDRRMVAVAIDVAARRAGRAA